MSELLTVLGGCRMRTTHHAGDNMTQPDWPTAAQVSAEWSRSNLMGSESVAQLAIDKCIAAWRTANDDPRQSPIGEVRREPNKDRPQIAVRSGTGWTLLAIHIPSSGWLGYEDVRGWPVIGGVPGTPAAEAQA